VPKIERILRIYVFFYETVVKPESQSKRRLKRILTKKA